MIIFLVCTASQGVIWLGITTDAEFMLASRISSCLLSDSKLAYAVLIQPGAKGAEMIPITPTTIKVTVIIEGFRS
ncbi:MAG: hypothetical protein CL784_05145 [Chloroflexi bacterium]|nr:hypothetical protein [Chloroflexota bacterium]